MRRSSTDIDRARERFMDGGEYDPSGVVRREIADSWERSRRAGVDATRLDLPYDADLDFDGSLSSCARPVLDQIEVQLSGTAVAVVLTDADGRLLDRRVGEGELRRRMDDISLAPGFSYAEAHAGTNGVGTALQGAAAALVVGGEHFTERLQAFACAGAPVHHPVSRRLVGIVDVTCLEAEANSLMSVLAVQAARDIEQVLAERGSLGARAVMAEFQSACRRSDHPVVALADDFLIANREAQTRLDRHDHEQLRGRAEERMSFPLVADDRILLSIGPARLRCRPVPASGHPAGVVVEVVPGTATTRLAVPSTSGPPTLVEQPASGVPAVLSAPSLSAMSALTTARTAERTFAGLAGTSASWRASCAVLRHAVASRRPTLVVGEPGVGKAALVVAAHRERHPTGHCVELDARRADVAEAIETVLADPGGADSAVVVRHLEALGSCSGGADGPDAFDLSLLTALLELDGPWVVGLVSGAEVPPGPVGRALLDAVGAPVVVEPLRHRPQDVDVIVPALVDRLAGARRVRISPASTRLLAGGLWPGNVTQITDVLRAVLATKPGGEVEPEDLPPEVGVHGTRRRLSPIEAAERDLIVAALIEARGNRVHAAKALGMGRATLYRRLRAFGITEVGR